jgi:mannose-6-phosphate isomerase
MMDAMTVLPPIRFEPILREYLWGGRRLGSELGKPIGPGDHYAESWEIVDHGADQSIVVDGPLAGSTLHELVAGQGPALFGRHDPRPQFPLLFKFLDAHQTLSVQVHPNDELKPGVDRIQLEEALRQGRCEECLHVFEPAVGDCLLIEAGTVHALGAGLLMAEIQQASDTTFRLFDWNRVDRDGKPRPLHIRESLETIDFNRGPVGPRAPQRTDRPWVERLVACDKFVLDRWRIDRPAPLRTEDRFHILSVVEGEVNLAARGAEYALRRGSTVLIPASSAEVELAPHREATLLDMYLP